MRLLSLHIANYKSLRDIEFQPNGLSVLIGPNGAGKSNFCDAINFLSIVYGHGLEAGVSRKGGFENIAFRRARRTPSSLRFSVTVELDETEIRSSLRPYFRMAKAAQRGIITHRFEFRSTGQTIDAEYRVLSEELEATAFGANDRAKHHVSVVRPRSGAELIVKGSGDEVLLPDIKPLFERAGAIVGPQELLLPRRALGLFLFEPLARFVANMSVFHLSPQFCRHSGVPTPNPYLSPEGDELPSMVDWLRTKHKREWNNIRETIREIIPRLSDISVEFLYDKRMGLFFHEEGVGKPWTVADVSDGTINTLALLVATADPRISGLVIEEPENSIHPWVIREITTRLRAAAEKKFVLLTTHSPYLIDTLYPSEAWIVSRENGETGMRPLVELDDEVEGLWKAGGIRLSEYLDAGLVPGATPGANA